MRTMLSRARLAFIIVVGSVLTAATCAAIAAAAWLPNSAGSAAASLKTTAAPQFRFTTIDDPKGAKIRSPS